MSEVTILAGFVLAVALGAVLAMLWLRVRSAAADARNAADASRPLADTLARIEAQIQQVESQRQHMLGGLEAQVSSLSRETVALAQALKGTNTRGRWGELTLRRVAELAGMVPHCDFYEQVSEDRKRPDMLVKLPGNRTLAVDAKAPLTAYLDAEAAPDPAARTAALDRHAQMLARHVNDLAARDYWAQFGTAPEMVILFLPGEHFLSAALERRQDLVEAAVAKKVLIATPVTLVSVLKGIAYGWRQERLARNAEELRKIAGEFQERVRVFGESYADLGRQLARSVDTYNRSVGSWDSRLLPSLKRMRELGVGTTGDVPEPPRVDTGVRSPQAVEATDGASQATLFAPPPDIDPALSSSLQSPLEPPSLQQPLRQQPLQQQQ